MNSKKARSREYRTKSGTTSQQVPVRIMVTQADFERIKALNVITSPAGRKFSSADSKAATIGKRPADNLVERAGKQSMR